MSSIFIMVGASLMIAGGFLFAFIWSVKNGQYDDAYSNSVRPLFENEITNPTSNKQTSETKISTTNIKH